MLEFTQARIPGAEHIFYYNRKSQIVKVKEFSDLIFRELRQHLNIDYQMQQREELSKAVESSVVGGVTTIKQSYYDNWKINRYNLLYDNYVENVLEITQILYYRKLDHIYILNESQGVAAAQNTFNDSMTAALAMPQATVQNVTARNAAILAAQATLSTSLQTLKVNAGTGVAQFNRFVANFTLNSQKSGKPLQECFDHALEICKPLLTFIESQIEHEFPIDTFTDANLQSDAKVEVKKTKTKKTKKSKE